jgi:hypothetical protein
MMMPRRFVSWIIVAASLLSGRLLSASPAIVLLGAALAPPAIARGGRRVVWTEIRVTARQKRPDLERFLKEVVEKQTRKADWGGRGGEPLEARFQVTEFDVVQRPDVVRVTCTAVGRIQGAPSVRSHFSMGGRPAERADLERQLLTMLGRGIVSRLAVIARVTHKGSPS